MKMRIAYMALVATLLGVALFVRAVDPAPIARLRLQVFDVYQWLSPRVYDPGLPVRIVDIDESSIRAVGQWPWSRSVLARLTERLTELGASVIAFDLIFSEGDRSGPTELLKRLPPDVLADPAMRSVAARLAALASPDEAFGKAIEGGPVVLGFSGADAGGGNSLQRRAGFATAGDDPALFVPGYGGAIASLPLLQGKAKGAGSLNWVPEHDQIVRRLPLVVRIDKDLHPSLSAEALRVGQGAGSYVVKASGASGEAAFGRRTGLVSVRIGQLAVPTDASGQMWLRFSRTDPRRFISARRVLDGEITREDVEGRVILVGTSAPGLLDLRATPLDSVVAGVELHAQAIEQMLLDQYLERPDFSGGLELLLIAASGVLMAAFVYRTGAAASAALGAVVASGALAGSWAAFRMLGWLLDPIYPLVSLTGLYLATTVFLYWQTERERNRVRDAFKQYLAPSLVEELARHPEKLKLGGEIRQVTLMFCDVRGFTSISERLNARQLTHFLNQLLTPLTNAILQCRGTVDKYMGDAIMAFWNAPLDDAEHERNTALAALGMLDALGRLNREWASEAVRGGTTHEPVRIGIGINTDECCVGNLGSELRFDYSVIGDGVNVASRLEGQSKYYGLAVVLSETTARKLGDLALIEVDLVSVVGRQEATRIFTLLGDAVMRRSPEFGVLMDKHGKLLDAYRAQRFEEAEGLVEELRDMPGAAPLATVYAIYAERIAGYKINPPGAGWNGVTVADQK